MNQKAAILIPTILGREHYLNALLSTLKNQLYFENETTKNARWSLPEEGSKTAIFHGHFDASGVLLPVLIIVDKDNRERTIGEKRNFLTDLAINQGATHRAFIDDDDMVEPNYLALNAPGIIGDYDCNSLVGIYSCNGHTDPNKHIFIHSLKYTHWYEDD